MNNLVLAFLALVIPAVLSYDEKYDKIDADKIINDDALFDSYIKCMLDKGPCDAENSKEFKELLPEVIAQACGKCSPIQKKNVKKTVKAMQEKRPQDFDELRNKYDPKGEHQENFAAFLVAAD